MDHITGWNDKKNLQNIIDAGRDFDKWLIGIEDLIIILTKQNKELPERTKDYIFTNNKNNEPHQEN